MSIESLVEAYETILGKHRGDLFFQEDTAGYLTAHGQYVAHVTVSRKEGYGNAQAVAVHPNPTVAVLLAKVLAVSDLVGEPTLPLYEDAQELRGAYVPAATAVANHAPGYQMPTPAA